MGELSQGRWLWWETPLLHFSPMDTRHKRVTYIPVINAREEDWDGSTLCYSFCFDLDILYVKHGVQLEISRKLKIEISRHCESWKYKLTGIVEVENRNYQTRPDRRMSLRPCHLLLFWLLIRKNLNHLVVLQGSCTFTFTILYFSVIKCNTKPQVRLPETMILPRRIDVEELPRSESCWAEFHKLLEDVFDIRLGRKLWKCLDNF